MSIKYLPTAFIKSFESHFGKEEKNNLAQTLLNSEPVPSYRVNPFKKIDLNIEGTIVPWCETGFFPLERPSYIADPLYHAGTYYAQEAASMLAHHFIDSSVPLKVLDLCAAPGGKSTLLLSYLHEDSILISNEMLPQRNKVLQENIIKWGNENSVITQNKAGDFKNLEGFFDVILIDAPCSGEGMMRKDEKAVEHWNEGLVLGCAKIQRELLIKALELVKSGGKIIYSTCTFESVENENQIQFIMEHFPHEFKTCELPLAKDWGLHEVLIKERFKGYYAFPHKFKGEGQFITCFEVNKIVKNRIFAEGKLDLQSIEKEEFLKIPYLDIIKINHFNVKQNKLNEVFYLPNQVLKVLPFLDSLEITLMGIKLGKFLKGDFVVDQHYASWERSIDKIPTYELTLNEARAYLQKLFSPKGEYLENRWQLVSYQGFPLGWVKRIESRSNNHYPQEWKIRKSTF